MAGGASLAMHLSGSRKNPNPNGTGNGYGSNGHSPPQPQQHAIPPPLPPKRAVQRLSAEPMPPPAMVSPPGMANGLGDPLARLRRREGTEATALEQLYVTPGDMHRRNNLASRTEPGPALLRRRVAFVPLLVHLLLLTRLLPLIVMRVLWPERR